ncbi:purine-cytosine permease FCY21 [Viridothelium virens]|uniref:Purine-cytosine permease FCY21 n=1 Tax=Viridothelium virens TaxID=1048519 RepID=A0A6A6HES7_VIRVR|nr:purine-cytosine permease FCY21 [Viridothelium virens]
MPTGMSKMDVEKGRVDLSSDHQHVTDSRPLDSGHHYEPPQRPVSSFRQCLQRLEGQMVAYNLETRGIKRVEAEERHDLKSLGYAQVAILWFSVNLAANNITLGMLGPAVYYLSFRDAALCAVFGVILGCLPVAAIATFGPISGNRTMILTRYTMGYYPSKLIVILELITLLGYALIDTVVAGQILSAVSPSSHPLTIVVGIVIVAIVTWAITTFGYSIFHYYERYAWAPQLVVLCILAGVAGPSFDLTTPSQGSNAATIAGDRLSFFSLCFSAAVTYAGGAADYFVYYPSHTPRLPIFAVTLLGLTLSFTFALILGIGLASGLPNHAAWNSAYGVSQGALIVEAYQPLGAFGSFCGVVVALGLVANLIPTTYSSGVDFQVLGRVFARVPRVVWNTVGVVIYTVCAAVGRDHLAQIFTNFLALMGYWVSIWFAICVEEVLIFRRRRGFDWEAWAEKKKHPLGVAALIAFLIGWVGAILCMAQVWYIGPIAKLVGDYGADMGNYVGFAWAALVFPPLRWLEVRKFGR